MEGLSSFPEPADVDFVDERSKFDDLSDSDGADEGTIFSAVARQFSTLPAD